MTTLGRIFTRGLVLALMTAAGLSAAPGAAQADSKYSAIVIDAQTGKVMFSRSADYGRYPASLAKLMTLYLLFEAVESGRLKMNSTLTASAHAAAQPPSELGLKKGDTIQVETAIKALVVKSANDVAVVVAEAIGGSESKFAGRMTAKARDLGMKHTTFRNASGLHNKRQRTTARDMATLARALIRNFPQYFHYFNDTRFIYDGKTFRTHNDLVTDYRGADGMKTGYIRASGYNLVTTAQRHGRRLIGVVFGGKTSRSRDRHMAAILDKTFARLDVGTSNPKVASAGPPPLKPVAEKDDAPVAVADAPTVASSSFTFPSLISSAHASTEGLSGAWAIQVGAYMEHKDAQRQAAKAYRQLRNRVNGAEAHVIPVQQGDKRFFRARIVGLSKDKANQACGALKMDCMVVPPS